MKLLSDVFVILKSGDSSGSRMPAMQKWVVNFNSLPTYKLCTYISLNLGLAPRSKATHTAYKYGLPNFNYCVASADLKLYSQ